MPRFTLYGFYEYDKTLFEGVKLPPELDRDLLVDEIITKHGDLYPYIQMPRFLKLNITNYFSRMYGQFQKMAQAIQTDYKPLENYDRYEDITDVSHGTSEGTSTGREENKVSAYNTSTYSPSGETTNNGTATSSSDGSTTHTAHIHGNIGVTTSAQMLSGELDVREYDIYKRIAQLFEKEFLVQVY